MLSFRLSTSPPRPITHLASCGEGTDSSFALLAIRAAVSSGLRLTPPPSSRPGGRLVLISVPDSAAFRSLTIFSVLEGAGGAAAAG